MNDTSITSTSVAYLTSGNNNSDQARVISSQSLDGVIQLVGKVLRPVLHGTHCHKHNIDNIHPFTTHVSHKQTNKTPYICIVKIPAEVLQHCIHGTLLSKLITFRIKYLL